MRIRTFPTETEATSKLRDLQAADARLVAMIDGDQAGYFLRDAEGACYCDDGTWR